MMDGDDLWSAAVTGEQLEYPTKKSMKKQVLPSHNYSSNYDEHEYGCEERDYFTDRPKMYSSKKSYDEGQYNYGDAQIDPPKSKKTSFFPSSHHTKNQPTTQLLASKKYFSDKQNKFNVPNFRGSSVSKSWAPMNNQPNSNPVVKPNAFSKPRSGKPEFDGGPAVDPDLAFSEKRIHDGLKYDSTHPNLRKDGILLGLSHEDKVLFYNTRSNSGTENSELVDTEPEDAQSAFDNYHKYHYVRKKPNDKGNVSYRQDSKEDQAFGDNTIGRNQKQRAYNFAQERIQGRYNDEMKEKGSSGREGTVFNQFDDRNVRVSDRGQSNVSRYGGNRDDNRGFVSTDGWREEYQERDDGYGGDMRYESSGREDDNWYKVRDVHDGRKYNERDRFEDARYGGRESDDDERHGDREWRNERMHSEQDLRGRGRYEADNWIDDKQYEECRRQSSRYDPRRWEDGRVDSRDGSDRFRHGNDDIGRFDRDLVQGSRFDDRDVLKEEKFNERPITRDKLHNKGFGEKKAFYILPEDQEPARDYGAQKEIYPVKGTFRNKTKGYPVKGKRNLSGNQNLTNPVKHKPDPDRSIFKPRYGKEIGKDTSNGSSSVKPVEGFASKDKYESRKTDKEDIKMMLLAAADKSVLDHRKSRAEAPNTDSPALNSGMIQSNNQFIRYMVPYGNHSVPFSANVGNRPRNPSSVPDSVSINPTPSSSESSSKTNTTNDDSPGGNVIRGPTGNPLYPVANPPPNAVIQPFNQLMNPLINPAASINAGLRIVPPLQIIGPGGVPLAAPNAPMILRYNALPAPVFRHPLLSNVTIPPTNDPPFMNNQPLRQDIVQNSMANIGAKNQSRAKDNNKKIDKNTTKSVNICENNSQPLKNIPVSNNNQPIMNLGHGILPNPMETEERKRERSRLLLNAIKQIDARKSVQESSKSKKFKVNPKKPWFDHECHVLHKRRLRKLVRLKKARNQKNEKDVEELKQVIREINREYVPLLRERKSKYIAELESKGEISLLCEMAITSLVDRVVQIRKIERKEKERLPSEGKLSKDGTNIIVIDDDHEEMEDEQVEEEEADESVREVIEIDIDEVGTSK